MNNITLKYEADAYQAFYQDEFICPFSHSNLARGQTDPEEAKKIVGLINFSAREIHNVYFNPEMITPASNQLADGACSAVALRVAKEALEIMTKVHVRKDLSPTNKEKAILNRLRNLISELYLDATKQNKESEEKRKQIRTLQQAFNTITVKREIQTSNVVGDKIKALASFFDLKISESTRQFDVSHGELEKDLQNQRQTLKEGVYLLRVISYKYNHKLEESGHSTIYIKTAHSEFYFDLNIGFYFIFNDSTKKNVILNSLYSAKSRFQVDQLSFHKLENVPLTFSEILSRVEKAREKICPEFARKAFDTAMHAESEGNSELALQIRKNMIGVISARPADALDFKFLTPELTGEFPVGMKRFYIEDSNRKEKDLGHPLNGFRSLELDVFYPAIRDTSRNCRVLSLLNKGYVEDSKALSRAVPDLLPLKEKRLPVILFAPSLGGSLDDYSPLLEELASHGFFVIGMNHPCSTLFTRYLGSDSYVLPELAVEGIIQEGYIRAEDFAFVIRQIQAKAIKELEFDLGEIIDRRTIGVFGHSLGGSAASLACRLCPEILACIDLDGRLIQKEGLPKFKQPSLLVVAGMEKKEREAFTEAFQATQVENPQLTQLVIEKAQHKDFSIASSYRVDGIKNLNANHQAILKDANGIIVSFFKKHVRA